MKGDTCSLAKAQAVLLLLWAVCCLSVFLLILSQTSRASVYNGREGEVWNWLFSNILPSTGLLFGWVVGRMHKKPEDQQVSRISVIAIIVVACLYLLLLIFVVGRAPVWGSPDPLSSLKNSTVFLSVFQGLVATGLASMFGGLKAEPPTTQSTP
jgi:hypothetical protein